MNVQDRSVKEIRCAVVKNENESHDANVMAQLQNQRSQEVNHEKKNKFQNFMNSTRLNASKIYKEKQSKQIEDSNAKKIMAQKQREVKAKYTVLEKKKEQPRVLDIQPTKVDWKRVDPMKGVSVPLERLQEDSSDEGSAIDSQAEQINVTTPLQLIKEREGVRYKMLNKYSQNSKPK